MATLLDVVEWVGESSLVAEFDYPPFSISINTTQGTLWAASDLVVHYVTIFIWCILGSDELTESSDYLFGSSIFA
jgi:hypothetical protein